MPVQGLKQLNRKLKELPVAAQDALRPAMEALAQDVVNLAKSLVSVEDGELRDSINWTWGDAPAGAIVLGTTRQARNKNKNMIITIYAGDDKAFYARWVEFGTSPHGLAKGGGGPPWHPGSRPFPFFYPSWRANKKRAKTRISRAINKSARAVAASGGN